tara:strand:+ start:849 stop:1214 length:366 start_codon:yes stop_codon:yes gene_type:complete
MAIATGYITVGTEIDIADYEGEFEIEFDNLEDVIDTAASSGYSKQEIIDYCFDEGMVDPAQFMQEYLSVEQITEIYQHAIVNRIDELSLTISNQRDRIKELEAQLANTTKTDEELVKDVAY